jgi:Sec-independent protein translocase protein TatA
MLTDLLGQIYNRISQLGKAIQELKKSLDDLNNNIEQKITSLTEKMDEFSREIDTTQTKHIDVLNDIGSGVSNELKILQNGLGLEAMNNLINNLEKFSSLASEVLNQETVNLLLSEAIDSVKTLKERAQFSEE